MKTNLEEFGLEINVSKCVSMNIIIYFKKRMWICSPSKIISIYDDHIKALSIAETYAYLILHNILTGRENVDSFRLKHNLLVTKFADYENVPRYIY